MIESAIGGKPIDMDWKYKLVTRGYMARGKDGFDSLLVKSEGGACEEEVSEENGILLSQLMRQYFMSLRTVGKWNHWGPDINRHWGKVADDVSRKHPTMVSQSRTPSPVAVRKKPSTLKREHSSWDDFTPNKLRERRSNLTGVDGPVERDGDKNDLVDDEDDEADGENLEAFEVDERELSIMRRVIKKWCRLAKVHAKACDGLNEGEFEVQWTKAVSPQVEGRIVRVGAT